MKKEFLKTQKKNCLVRLAFGIMLMSVQSLFAQTNTISVRLPSSVPVSPDAAALMKYVDYPVDYSVGLPNITIPLYEIKVGDLTLPITLSYHASGLKPREASGWVGKGWTLIAEPSVARNVNGLPDEKPNAGYLNNFHNHNAIGNEQTYLRQMVSGVWDEEPDRFYYKLLSENGSYYLNRKYEGYTMNLNPYLGFAAQPFSPLEIHYLGNLSSFNIKDKNGVYYEYGGPNLLEYAGNNQDVITKWLCNYVQGATTGARINFSYASPRPILVPSRMIDMVTIEDQKTNYPFVTENQGGLSMGYHLQAVGPKVWDPEASSVSFETPVSYESGWERKLQEINFDNGKVTLFSNETSTYSKLDSIIVYDKEGNLIKQINFFVSRFNTFTEHTKLDSIQIKNNEAKTISYKMEYNSPSLVPSIQTRGIDHWGFYNLQANTSGLAVPASTISTETLSSPVTFIEYGLPGIDRDCNFVGMQVGSLRNITSPEGASTSFTYEPHKYGYVLHPINNIPVFVTGGLRISQINVSDSKYTANGYIRSFDYGEILQVEQEKITADWGIPKHKVTANDYCYSRKMVRINNWGVSGDTRLRFWTSNPITNITYNNGSSMIYGTVTEKYVAKSDGKMLITRRKYNVPEGFATEPQAAEINDQGFNPDIQGDFVYGQLISEEKFNDTGTYVNGEAVYTPVSKTEYVWSKHKSLQYDYISACQDGISGYNYPCIDGGIRFAKAYNRNVVFSASYPEWDYESLNYVSWSLENGIMKIDTETNTTYTNGNPVTETKVYNYDDRSNHMLPIKVTTTGSDNDVKEEYFSYAEDLILNAPTVVEPENLGQNELLMHRVITNPLEYKVEKNGTVQSTRMKYDGKRPLLVKTKGAGNQAYENRTNYHTYNGYGNPVETSYQDGPRTCYLWSYNSQSPVAKIENATYAQVVSALGQGFIDALRPKSIPLSGDLEQLNNLRVLLPAAHINTYTYKPLVGMSSITDPKGQTIYYDYDGWGRLKRTYTKDLNSLGQLQENTRKSYDYRYRSEH